MTDEYDIRVYSQYVSERQKLHDAYLERAGVYDRAVLTISTGALALSVLFVEKIAPHPIRYTIIFLVLAWVLMLSAMVFQLLALATSSRATRKQIDLLDAQYREILAPVCDTDDPTRSPPATENTLGAPVIRFQTISLWVLVAGMALLMVFSATNVAFR